MNGALAQAFSNQCELARFQVAQSAVDQLAGAARCAARQGIALDEQGLMARRRRRLKDPGTMNAAADDDHIVFFHESLRLGFGVKPQGCVITPEHTNFARLSPFANTRNFTRCWVWPRAFPRIA